MGRTTKPPSSQTHNLLMVLDIHIGIENIRALSPASPPLHNPVDEMTPLATDPGQQSKFTQAMGEIKLDTGLTPQQWHHVTKLIYNNLDVFSEGPTDLGKTCLVLHDIMIEAPRICQPSYRESQKGREMICNEIQNLLDSKVASPSVSPRASSVVLVEILHRLQMAQCYH